DEEYIVDDTTHHWSPKLVDNVMSMKRIIFDKAKKEDYDYLLMVDSDMIMQPKTITHLLSYRKNIISEVSWTKWRPEEQPMPNSWWYHNFLFPPDGLERLRKENSLVEVGGFGAMALITKKAILDGVCYDRIDNLNPDWGEDRHFAVRANILGYKLFVDTTYPIKHLYRTEDYKETPKKSVNSGVLIAVPHTGNVNANLCRFLINLYYNNREHKLNLLLNWGMPVDSNRNHIVKQFLDTDYEWLLMIDSDVVPPKNVLNLLKHNKKIVGAICMTATSEGIPYPVIMKKNKNKVGFRIDRDIKPLMEVDATGCACLLIHREVLESIKNPFRLGYNKDGIVTEIGEDFDFCLKSKKAGYKVYVDTTLQCQHFREVDLLSVNKEMGKIKNG
ncbi:hypothetical protein LCGC14_2585690, partial [marine sediment metagenome]